MIKPYYQDADGRISLYLGRMEDVLPALDQRFDAAICDPPYCSTGYQWDRWPEGWPKHVAAVTDSMWCFGNLRMFMARSSEFHDAGWNLSHDAVGEFEVDTAVWEKGNGSGFQADRLRCVHELMAHWYQGRWGDIHHDTPKIPCPERERRGGVIAPVDSTPHMNAIGARPAYDRSRDRLQRSVVKALRVIQAKNMRGKAIHPTEKPAAILEPLIKYTVPEGGTVIDPFAGSASTLMTARMLGRKAVGVEGNEEYCERAARRLSDPDCFGGAA